MVKSYKYRIVPNKTQEVLLSKTFGCVRYYWNGMVAAFNSYDKESNPNPVYKTAKEIRNDIEWMNEVSAAALQQKARDFDSFKKQRFNKDRLRSIGNPNFKKKSNRQSFRLPNQKVSVGKDRIRLEKIGWVKMVVDRVIPDNAKILSCTVSKTPTGKHFVSIAVDQESHSIKKTGYEVGIDVGLKEFMTQSDGVVVENPRYFRKSQSKIEVLQRHLSRKKKGSVRSRKLKMRISRLHEKVANQRSWFIHNESTRLVREFDVICIEDLNVSGMVKNRKLSKSISDASFSMFYRSLEYKCDWYGKKMIKIPRFYPSSKTCSGCGWVDEDLSLKDRVFKCESCGLDIDRDLNAAINIYTVGVKAVTDAEVEVTKPVKRLKLECH